jgi:hypothetical protein
MNENRVKLTQYELTRLREKREFILWEKDLTRRAEEAVTSGRYRVNPAPLKPPVAPHA